MRLRSAHVSETGLRMNNEDSLLDTPGLYAVADGMGGHAAGEVASRLAIETLKAAQPQRASDVGASLVATTNLAHDQILRAMRKNPTSYGMGTTLTALAFGAVKPIVATIGHVGDSRGYLIREGRESQLTTDHTSPLGQNVLDRCLGGRPEVDHRADVIRQDIEIGDIFVLATDGLDIDPTLIANIVRRHRGKTALIDAANQLVQEALRAGSRDNITVVLVEVLA